MPWPAAYGGRQRPSMARTRRLNERIDRIFEDQKLPLSGYGNPTRLISGPARFPAFEQVVTRRYP